MDINFATFLDITTLTIEAAGVVVIVIGISVAFGKFIRDRAEEGAYRKLRSTLGRAILLGLELLVAADIINTVAIEPSLDSLAVLAGIVLVRTFLSLSLEVEIEGKWPWHRAASERSAASARDGDR
ncbi:DUF1622 domain-containing protein [Ciceribacter sp. L1K22]|uniref:DUF1622 domain-containing protein n=1 Tax=Ciceribacter sp. L1K22 TaxID=2820275 RepID=UPI001ABE9198|nr:DUF1622 domain-containing protein [Ciceribacter sp. L1K22]MBO3760640.1 DUF1622 domain-containing protein [Ciceribacter sp. L1K22]